MRIACLNGPSQDSCDRFFGWPTSILYALAPTAAAIARGDYNLSFVGPIYDPVWYVADLNGTSLDQNFAQLCLSADVVCASATYDSLYPTLRLLASAKRSNPRLVTVLGGPHVDEVSTLTCGAEVLRSPVDIAISGDGECALLAVLAALAKGGLKYLDLSQVRGKVSLYDRGTLIGTANHHLDLNHLPPMPLYLADIERHKCDFDIFQAGGNIVPTAQMITQRGCAYSCDFCSERRELAYVSSRSVDNIIGEVLLRKSQGFGAIFFDDSTFGLYPKLSDLLDALRQTGMIFGCLNRFNHLVDPKILQMYRDAGFQYFYCSIEQLADDALRLMGKAQNREKIERSMELLESFGFALGVSLLYGLPYETGESIKATLDFTAEWVTRGVIKLVSESVLAFHPGTPAGRSSAGIFNRVPPNRGYPYNRFEEGQWEHPSHVTADYLEEILRSSEERFGCAMVRNRHSWYAQSGLTTESTSGHTTQSAREAA